MPPASATPPFNTLASSASRKSPDYGIDAPGVRRGMFIAGAFGTLLGATAVIVATRSSGSFAQIATVLAGVGAFVALYGAGMGTYMTYESRVRKLHTRDHLLDLAEALGEWNGSERILDVGCGRGLLLIGAARRLPSGTAVGVDLWRDEDQADVSAEAALENARCEGVADRVQVETGDARALPFQDASFDAVLSHWVVHNLPSEADRVRAVDEMCRVLRPGGVLVLADIAHLAEYRSQLAARGVTDVRVLDGGWEARVMGVLSGGSYRPQALVARVR